MKKLLTVLLFVPITAMAGEDLIKKYGCIGCHAVDKKLVGPAFKDVSAKYKSEKDNVSLIAGKIKSGGSGTWGPIPMPPQAHVSDADAEQIAKWILSK